MEDDTKNGLKNSVAILNDENDNYGTMFYHPRYEHVKAVRPSEWYYKPLFPEMGVSGFFL